MFYQKTSTFSAKLQQPNNENKQMDYVTNTIASDKQQDFKLFSQKENRQESTINSQTYQFSTYVDKQRFIIKIFWSNDKI